ncbi:hypothetical protein ACIRF8_19905 [Streptomyces sp. NPDC102406]|uniref:hypothetical protein n=1 Tax=Streptomyces sp. NPDC102406 TaxID=3366171 RepID=UPI0038117976
MRTTSLRAPRALTVAAATALPLLLGAPVASAAGVDVAADGSAVTATTDSCPHGGTAALLRSGQADFAGGSRAALGSGGATWRDVAPGTYQVVVACSDGTTLGPVPVTVRAVPAGSATPRPSGAVRGGLGGTVREAGTPALVAGGALIAAAVGAVWYLRRRAVRPNP